VREIGEEHAVDALELECFYEGVLVDGLLRRTVVKIRNGQSGPRSRD
jgi:hypothetical protein